LWAIALCTKVQGELRIEKKRRLFCKEVTKKQPCCNWIEMNNIVHSFEVPDQENPQMLEIRKQLKQRVIEVDE
jgi:hypothetical protein